MPPVWLETLQKIAPPLRFSEPSWRRPPKLRFGREDERRELELRRLNVAELSRATSLVDFDVETGESISYGSMVGDGVDPVIADRIASQRDTEGRLIRRWEEVSEETESAAAVLERLAELERDEMQKEARMD